MFRLVKKPRSITTLSSLCAFRGKIGSRYLGNGSFIGSQFPKLSEKTWQCDRSLHFLRSFATAAGSLPPHEVHSMPALSPTATDGAIVEWLKKEGDKVEEGTEIAQIQTDKSIVAWVTTDEGYLAKQLCPANPDKKLPVGTPIAIIVQDPSLVAAFKNVDPKIFSTSSSSSSTSSSAASSSSAAASTSQQQTSSSNQNKPKLPSNLPSHQIHGMPALSPTATDGAIVEWLIKEGDHIEEGTEIAQVQTDKSAVAWTSTDEGYLAKKLVDANPDKKFPVGAPIAVIVFDKSHVDAFKNLDSQLFTPTAASSSPAEPTKTAKEAPQQRPAAAAPQSKISHSPSDRVLASPFAKKRAKELNVSLSNVIKGSGIRGRITAADVEKIAKEGPAKKKTSVPSSIGKDRSFEDIPLSEMRKIIARRLSESMSTSPHYYVTVECEMDNLMAMRKEMNEGEDTKVSVNDFIIKAAARAIRDVPDVNVSWLGDKLRKYNYVDISVAVATPTGLITPIVTDADKRTIGSISSTVKELATRAKDNKLLPHEFQGGTLTISNLGMYGVKQFTAIINPPQSCIIAIGGTASVVKPDGKGGYKAVSTMLCTISSDHRTVDGALAAQYMQAFKKYIENPSKLML